MSRVILHIDDVSTDRPQASHDDGIVTFVNHDTLSLQTNERVIARMLCAKAPRVRVMYKDLSYVGAYPLGEASYITWLAAVDRDLVHDFFVACESGRDAKSLVTSIAHLLMWSDIPKSSTDPFCAGNADAFILPSKDMEEGGPYMQVSAQFSQELVLTNDNRILTIKVTCSDLQPVDVVFTGSSVYEAFELRCRDTKKRMRIVESLYNRTRRPTIRVTSTILSGHKLWVYSQDCQFVTFYVVRHMERKKNRQVMRLRVMAIDIKVKQPSVLTFEDPSNECVVCAEELSVQGNWHCSVCANSLHARCAEACRRMTNPLCPFCRQRTL